MNFYLPLRSDGLCGGESILQLWVGAHTEEVWNYFCKCLFFLFQETNDQLEGTGWTWERLRAVSQEKERGSVGIMVEDKMESDRQMVLLDAGNEVTPFWCQVCRHRRCGCWGGGAWKYEGEEKVEDREEEVREEEEDEGTVTLNITGHTVIVRVEGRHVS